MRNILVSHSINQAQEPLNESGIGRLEEDNRLLVTLSQEKKKKKMREYFLKLQGQMKGQNNYDKESEQE